MSSSDQLKLTGSALVVEPGDMLIIGLSASLTAMEAQRISKQMSDEMPGVRVCLLDQVAALAVVKDVDHAKTAGSEGTA